MNSSATLCARQSVLCQVVKTKVLNDVDTRGPAAQVVLPEQ